MHAGVCVVLISYHKIYFELQTYRQKKTSNFNWNIFAFHILLQAAFLTLDIGFVLHNNIAFMCRIYASIHVMGFFFAWISMHINID